MQPSDDLLAEIFLSPMVNAKKSVHISGPNNFGWYFVEVGGDMGYSEYILF